MNKKKMYNYSCEQTLYFNSTKHHIPFQYNCTTPKNQFSLALHAVCFFPLQSLTKLCDFPDPISGLIQNSVPIFKPGLVLHFKTWREQLPTKMLLGCIILKVYFLRGSSKAYSLYKEYITVHFTVPDKKVQLYSSW